jgi:hypothetical protein
MKPRQPISICCAALLAWAAFTSTMRAEPADPKTLFNFQTAAESTGWTVVNDGVMGGVSTSQFQASTNGWAVFSGTVRLENNGGFASVRSAPMVSNLTGCSAFVLRVRGDGRRYKFTVRTVTGFNAPLYQSSFTTKAGVWEEHRLPLSDFVATFRGRVLPDEPPLNGANINSVGLLISDQQAGPFRLEIAWIKAVPPAQLPEKE